MHLFSLILPSDVMKIPQHDTFNLRERIEKETVIAVTSCADVTFSCQRLNFVLLVKASEAFRMLRGLSASVMSWKYHRRQSFTLTSSGSHLQVLQSFSPF